MEKEKRREREREREREFVVCTLVWEAELAVVLLPEVRSDVVGGCDGACDDENLVANDEPDRLSDMSRPRLSQTPGTGVSRSCTTRSKSRLASWSTGT